MRDNRLLSLCIPIYNRGTYLEKMLLRFFEDKELFENDIELIISDNCSEEDLKAIVDSYRQQGLEVTYYRQETNIGPDGNFLFCFGKAKGKYCWLLGSDDIPVKGFLRYLVGQLDCENDYGLVYLRLFNFNKWYRSITTSEINSEVTVDNQKMLCDINVWITFMSSSIIRTEFIQSLNLAKYQGTSLIQVPLYVKSCLSSDLNLFINYNHCFEPDNDNASSGGYNFYKVFIVNLLSIMKEFVSDGLFSKHSYRLFKKNEFKYYIIENTISSLIVKNDKIHKLDGAWKILWQYYGKTPSTYIVLVDYFIKRLYSKLFLR